MQVQKMAWWYWSFIDWMIANPGSAIKDAAPVFGVTPQTLYIIKNSDSFKRHFDIRVKEISTGINQDIIGAFSGIADKTAALAEAALDTLQDRVEAKGRDLPTAELTSIADLTLKKLGYSQPEVGPPGANVTVNILQANSEALARARAKLEKVPSQEVKLLEGKAGGSNV